MSSQSTNQEAEKQKKKVFNSFIINNLILISGIIMIFSGLAMQFGFHVGGPHGSHGGGHGAQFQSMQYEQVRQIDTNKIVCGLNYHGWSTTHKYAIVIFSLLMIYHVYMHWKWYKGVITKRLIIKNIQVITLSVIFLLVAITGLVPWFIDLSGSTSFWRMLSIEIHDKLTFILIIYLILHLIKRMKWYAHAYAKLKR